MKKLRIVALSASLAVLALAAMPTWSIAGGPESPDHPAESLYLQLGNIGLNEFRVYHVRDFSFDRADLHITLNDGVLAFTDDVAGRVTGAFFEGDGEVLLAPPNRIERASMSLFTGGAILEESFVTAYFRFNDDTFAQMLPSLRLGEHGREFITRWDAAARSLADSDALRLFVTLSQFLPTIANTLDSPDKTAHISAILNPTSLGDSFLHARIQGRKLGTFDIFYDSQSPEQIRAGQLRVLDRQSYYDTWTSFPLGQPGKQQDDLISDTGDGAVADTIHIVKYKIRADVKPPTALNAEAWLNLEVIEGGQRALLFELSRFLRLDRVEADGQPVEFIHNQSLEGTQLARRGDDLVAVVFPQPLASGQRVDLHFVYGGDVLADAGAGLLYVGARGIWYPNRGLAMADYDLEFRTPPGWSLVATGKRVTVPTGETLSASGEQMSRWVSTRPIPVAGFNLGKYTRTEAHAGDVTVNVYATPGVEQSFPKAAPQVLIPPTSLGPVFPQPQVLITPAQPTPARNAQSVADATARSIEFFAHEFGPYPYDSLSLTQMPGGLSQGWPGLIFLSSFSFLTREEMSNLHMDDVNKTISNTILSHETAHQWWGDTVAWAGYRDQWMVEALANYSALMLLERKDPSQFHAVLAKARDELLRPNKDGMPTMNAGPVTLGSRLSNSQFPDGYETISYGRGTWLLHMLRCMMRDAESKGAAHPTGSNRQSSVALTQSEEEPFTRSLRKLRERYEGKAVTTAEFLHSFEAELPPSLWYEGRRSLEWFYQGWVNGTAIPHFSLRAVKFTDKPGATIAAGTILQKDSPEDQITSIPVYAVAGKNMVLLGRVFADGPETQFHLSAPAGTRKVVLDPNQTVLAQIK